MTSTDVFQIFLTAADDVERVFHFQETRLWPEGDMDRCLAMNLLRPAATGLYAPCPNCAEHHMESATTHTGPDGRKRFYIWCPESLRVEVTAEMCKGWEVDPNGLARALATAMGINSSPMPLVNGRLWRLGRVPWKGSSREVVLALRMMDTDAASVAAHIGPGGRTIVLVPCHPPDERVWPGHVPAVVALSRLATFTPQGINLDLAAISEIVADADARAEAKSMLPVDPEVKKQVVRQQVKAEIKGHLNDDVLVAAYIEFGSYRKAAFGLTERLGYPITKDAIEDAIKRAGGIKAVKETSDVSSISRTVASQPRDRAKKISQYR